MKHTGINLKNPGVLGFTYWELHNHVITAAEILAEKVDLASFGCPVIPNTKILGTCGIATNNALTRDLMAYQSYFDSVPDGTAPTIFLAPAVLAADDICSIIIFYIP